MKEENEVPALLELPFLLEGNIKVLLNWLIHLNYIIYNTIRKRKGSCHQKLEDAVSRLQDLTLDVQL